MAKIPVLPPGDAPAAVNDVYVDFHRKMGFPEAPNFIQVQGHSIAVARGTWALVENVLVNGLLPRALKEMMFVAVSRDRGCRYCEAAHLACCRMLGLDAATISEVTASLDTVHPLKTRDLLKFAVKCARDPQSIDAADVATLRGHGLTQSEIVEAIAMSALAVYANTIADATGVEADQMFMAF